MPVFDKFEYFCASTLSTFCPYANFQYENYALIHTQGPISWKPHQYSVMLIEKFIQKCPHVFSFLKVYHSSLSNECGAVAKVVLKQAVMCMQMGNRIMCKAKNAVLQAAFTTNRSWFSKTRHSNGGYTAQYLFIYLCNFESQAHWNTVDY